MPKKTLVVEYKGSVIRVENTWFNGARLYVDNGLRDRSSRLFSLGERPVLRTNIETGRTKDLIEVFCRAVVTVKLKICANGEQIAGEHF